MRMNILSVFGIRPEPIKMAPVVLALAAASHFESFVRVTAQYRQMLDQMRPGQGFVDLCTAIRDFARAHRDWDFVYPVHLKPHVQQPVLAVLGGEPNVALIAPQNYEPFMWLMAQCDLILTDSGGIQEEAPSLGLGKPVLVMRETTERPEAVEAGVVRLVGTGRGRITAAVSGLLGIPTDYARMAYASNAYGEGQATERILARLSQARPAPAAAACAC